jgi:hypothetical protein
MRDYEIVFEIVTLSEDSNGQVFERVTIESDSAFNAVARLGQRIGESHKTVIEIFSVEEI